MKYTFLLLGLTAIAFFLIKVGIIGSPSQANVDSLTSGLESPVVVELFTSQSCSSCPPADKILGQLAQDNNVIALSCNVTYWNHLHWKDTLSHEFCTDRQRNYSFLDHRGGRVFTPEMVINGKESVVGSRWWDVADAIQKQSGQIKPVSLTIKAGTLKADLPNTSVGDKNASVSLVVYGQNHTQDVASGENRGRTIAYTNPIQSIHLIETEWDGDQRVIDIPLNNELFQDAAGYAVLAQAGTGGIGPIVAAGKITP